MAEAVLTHSSLERLNSWHPLTSILDSPKLDGQPNLAENCSAAAKMVMTNFLNSGDIRSLKTDCLPSVPAKAALAEPQPGTSDASAVPAPAERPLDDGASTSRVPEDVFAINFADMDVAEQAENLFDKGPLRTLSSRTFEALLDDTGLREAEEWTALQNLPSLPRDETLPRPTDTLADSIKAEEEAAAAAAVFLPQEPAPAEAETADAPPADEPATGGIEAAREKAVQARVRADEARRYATQKTAAATALTMQAMEILDVAATVKGRPHELFEPSGLQTPSVLSERPWNQSIDEPSSPTSSTVGHKRNRAGSLKDAGKSKCSKGKKAVPIQPQLQGDETDMEDDTGVPLPVLKAPKAPKKLASAEKPRGIQATDSIITSNGKKCRRGCLNCQAQKTPQWRMGPDGPKTLCNACGVRYRKGLPL